MHELCSEEASRRAPSLPPFQNARTGWWKAEEAEPAGWARSRAQRPAPSPELSAAAPRTARSRWPRQGRGAAPTRYLRLASPTFTRWTTTARKRNQNANRIFYRRNRPRFPSESRTTRSPHRRTRRPSSAPAFRQPGRQARRATPGPGCARLSGRSGWPSRSRWCRELSAAARRCAMVPRSSRPADRARRRPRCQPGSGRKKAGPGRSSSPRRVALSPHRACAAREARSVAQRASAPRGAGVRVGWGQSGKYGNAAFWGEPLHCLSTYGSAEGPLRKSHACFLFGFVVLFHLEPFFRVFLSERKLSGGSTAACVWLLCMPPRHPAPHRLCCTRSYRKQHISNSIAVGFNVCRSSQSSKDAVQDTELFKHRQTHKELTFIVTMYRKHECSPASISRKLMIHLRSYVPLHSYSPCQSQGSSKPSVVV